jgi:hypothetical protein
VQLFGRRPEACRGSVPLVCAEQVRVAEWQTR